MYEKYLLKLEEAGKIRNLKERSITCYKNYVSYFLNYIGKSPDDLTCQDVRDFILEKKESGIKSTPSTSTILQSDSFTEMFFLYFGMISQFHV